MLHAYVSKKIVSVQGAKFYVTFTAAVSTFRVIIMPWLRVFK